MLNTKQQAQDIIKKLSVFTLILSPFAIIFALFILGVSIFLDNKNNNFILLQSSHNIVKSQEITYYTKHTYNGSVVYLVDVPFKIQDGREYTCKDRISEQTAKDLQTDPFLEIKYYINNPNICETTKSIWVRDDGKEPRKIALIILLITIPLFLISLNIRKST